MNPRVWVAAAFVFLINCVINWRIVLPGITPYKGSIERGYAYMARLFADNPDYLSWNPLQYGGIPMHYVYLPLLPYFESLFLWLDPRNDATYLHRSVCAIALFLSPAAAFLLIRDWTGRAWAAFYSAIAVTLYSPLYYFIDPINTDRGIMPVPWRIQVLIKYGEGPHTVGMVFFFAALLLVRRAATRTGFPVLFAAAVALAATVLTNWVAGLALAFAVLMLLFVHDDDPDFSCRRVIQAGLLGYLLAAFWLTPSFVAQMAYNWPQDAFGFHFEWLERIAMLGWAAGLFVIRYAFRKLPRHRYSCWLVLCVFGYGLPVMLFYRYGVNSFPEARRYALEFEFFLLLLIVDCFRLLVTHRRFAVRAITTIGLLALLLQQTPTVTRYVSHRYQKWTLADQETTTEYRVARELSSLRPAGRVFASGGTRFRLNSWYPIPQVGGVFETGLKTRVPLIVSYRVRTDLGLARHKETEESIMLLRAFAVEYIVVHGPNSEEYYRDYKNPRKFEGVLEKVWEEKDDAIYRLGPVRYAHLLKTDEIPRGTIQESHQEPWYPYVAAMLDPTRPALGFRWENARRASVTGTLPKGMHVAFAIPWDPNFRAYQNGQRVDVRANSTGLMVTEALPADSTALELRFAPSWEEIVCALASIIAFGYSIRRIIRRSPA
ncbi:MAG: hypothetical protein HYX27_09010 [Acidobacteria bacterium]|nr:hypothetical protein [Acidobacteriota bacterium]